MSVGHPGLHSELQDSQEYIVEKLLKKKKKTKHLSPGDRHHRDQGNFPDEKHTR